MMRLNNNGYDKEPITYVHKSKQKKEFYPSKPESLAVTIEGQSFDEVSRMPIEELLLCIRNFQNTLDEHEPNSFEEIINEIELRLIYLNKIGLKLLPTQQIQGQAQELEPAIDPRIS